MKCHLGCFLGVSLKLLHHLDPPSNHCWVDLYMCSGFTQGKPLLLPQLLYNRDDTHFLANGVLCMSTFEPRLILLSVVMRVESSWVVDDLHGCRRRYWKRTKESEDGSGNEVVFGLCEFMWSMSIGIAFSCRIYYGKSIRTTAAP